MTRNISTILVATDFSPASSGALDYARLLALKLGASLRLIHVVDDPIIAAAWSEVYAFDTSELRERLRQTAETELARLAAQITDVPVTTEVIVGSPARAITGRTAEPDIDLVVMGTHGRSGMSHLLLGSVAERVVRSARCPVLTVREARAAEEVTESDVRAVPMPA